MDTRISVVRMYNRNRMYMLFTMFRDTVMSRIRIGRPPFGAIEVLPNLARGWGPRDRIQYDRYTPAQLEDELTAELKVKLGPDTYVAGYMTEFRTRIPAGRSMSSPYLIAACINVITSTTLFELQAAKALLTNALITKHKVVDPYVGNVLVQFNWFQFSGQRKTLWNTLKDNTDIASAILITESLREIHIVFYVVDFVGNAPVMKICFIPVTHMYTHGRPDPTQRADYDEDPWQWIASGSHVYFTDTAVANNDAIRRNTRLHIDNWVAYNDMVCVFTSIQQATNWMTAFVATDDQLSPGSEILIDASHAMLAYSPYKLELALEYRHLIDGGFTYIDKTDPLVWNILSKSRGFLGDKVRPIVMRVTSTVGIELQEVCLVATDVYFCIKACMADAHLPTTVPLAADELLSTRFSMLLTAIRRRDASQVRDTGWRMQKVLADAVLNAQWQLNELVRGLKRP